MTPPTIQLRNATEGDCETIFRWANDPATREESFSSGTIPWEEHIRWYGKKLRDPSCLFLIGMDAERRPVGSMRFEIEDDRATISVGICPACRGRGYGTSLVLEACRRLFEVKHVRTIDAYVKAENVPSRRIFEKAAFRKTADTERGGVAAVHYVLERPTAGATITIGDRTIGASHPVYIVAEMSANHGRDRTKAKEIISAMKEAGADAVKLQTYTPETITINCRNPYFTDCLTGTIWEGQSLWDLYTEGSMPWEWQPELKELSERLGMDFFSTPFDGTAVDFLETLNMSAYKIASFEIVHFPLIRRIARTGKPMILSTGMATKEEICEAVETARGAGATEIALLKCTSAYPATVADANVRTIPAMAEEFGVPVGLSDHTIGSGVPVAAVSQGACIIEKHFTLDRSRDSGPDASFSMEPHEFREMTEAIRAMERDPSSLTVDERALGEVRYGPAEGDRKNVIFRPSIFVVADIAEGETITEANVRIIRPGHGLPPKHWESVLGRKASRNIGRGTPLTWEMILQQNSTRTSHMPAAIVSNCTEAVILAGGSGTRLKAVFPNTPKVLAQVAGRPFLQHLLDHLAHYGVRRIVLCTGHLGSEVRQAFGETYAGMEIVCSQEPSPLGTGGALRLASPLLSTETVLVLNGDSFCAVDLSDLRRFHEEEKADCTVVLARVNDATRYGRAVLDDRGTIRRFEEKPASAGGGFVNAGIYLLSRRLLETIPAHRNVSLEHDLFPRWVTEWKVKGFPARGPLTDIGTPESYAEAQRVFPGVSP